MLEVAVAAETLEAQATVDAETREAQAAVAAETLEVRVTAAAETLDVAHVAHHHAMDHVKTIADLAARVDRHRVMDHAIPEYWPNW